MNYLLDTHTFIWTTLKTEKIKDAVKKIIINKSNDIYVSTITFWEISLKFRIKKYVFEGINIKDFPSLALRMGFLIMSINPDEAISYCDLELKKDHKDPFDRMLIWQAIKRKMILISKDKYFHQYKTDGLKLLW